MTKCREEKETARKLLKELVKVVATTGDPENAITAAMIGCCANTAGIDLMSKPMPESQMSMAERYKNQ